jgi:hypothetical protein
VTITKLPPATGGDGCAAVTATGETLVIHHLAIAHREAAAFVRSHQAEHGDEAAAEMVRRAVPVGLVALSMGTPAGIDTGSLTRTLDAFADRVDAKSQAAMASLDETLARLRAGEQEVARTAVAVLERLPAQVQAALGGEAGNVRASVVEATRTVQATGLQEITATMDRFSDALEGSLSLDREGPVRMLRQDLLEVLNGTRRELGDQLTKLTGAIESAQAAQTAGAKSSRAIGQALEHNAMALVDRIVTDAGDRFEHTGGQPGVGGTTRRTGDGVATLSPAITGRGPSVRLVIEAKHRTRPLTAKQYRDEIANGCRVRDAAGGLVLVPSRTEVPGEAAFARVDTCAYVVACEDPDTVALIYLLLREQVAMLRVRTSDDDQVDLAQVEARIELALSELTKLDEVGKLAVQAHRALEKLIALGRDMHQNVRTVLTDGVTLLHP